MTEAVDSTYAELLNRVDLFAEVARVALAQLAAYLEPVELADGDVLCSQGDQGDALYIVAQGALAVVVANQEASQETRLNTVTRGQFLGEMALITGEPRSATVRAVGPALVLRLDRDRFLDLLGREPSVARSVISVLSQRLRAADRARELADTAIRRAVESLLSTLPADQRLRLLQASLLPHRFGAVLEAVFGECAVELAAQLERLAAAGDAGATLSLRVLRERLEAEHSPEEIDDFRAAAGERLAEAGLWQDALALATPGRLVAVLRRAMRADPPLGRDEAVYWIERLSGGEAATDAEIALLAADIALERGRLQAAADLMRQALGVAAASGDAVGAQRIAERLAALSVPKQESNARRGVGGWGLGFGGRRPSSKPRPPLSAGAALSFVLAGGCVLAAVVLRDQPQWVFGLLLGAALALWNSNAIPEFAVGLALVGAWMLWGVARPQDAVAGFATMDWIFVMAVLGIAVAVARSGLLFRAGLLLVRRSPASLAPRAIALMLTGLLLSPLLPEPRGRAALTAPLALAVAEAGRFRDREPAAAFLGLAAWIGSGPLMFAFLNASPVCLLAWGLLPQEERARFDWLSWFVAALPFTVVLAAGMFGVLFVMLRPAQGLSVSRERLSLQLEVLGPPSLRERAVLAVLGFTVIGWFLAPALGVHVGTVAVFGFFAAAATGSFDQQSFRDMDWSFLIYYGVALSIQRLSANFGLSETVAAWVGSGAPGGLGMLLPTHPLVFLAIVAGLGFLARLFLEASQAVLLLALAFFPLAPLAGISPWLVAIALLATNNPWLTEKQTPAYQVAYVGSAGRLYSHSQARRVAVAYGGVTLFGLLALAPYWRAIGLL